MLRILVAEDDPVLRLLYTRTLDRAGHRVRQAADGLEAWEALQRERFDVLLTDWIMPSLDGLGLIKRVRGERTDHYLYIVVATSRAERESAREALLAGADDYLTKPVESADLLARMAVAERILALQHDLRTLRDQHALMSRYLEQANRRFTEIFLSLPVAALTLDLEGRIRDWNLAAEELLSLTPERSWDQPLSRQFSDIPTARAVREVVETALAGHAPVSRELSLQVSGNRRVCALVKVLPLGDRELRRGAIVTFTDLVAAEALEPEREAIAVGERGRGTVGRRTAVSRADRREFVVLYEQDVAQAVERNLPVALACVVEDSSEPDWQSAIAHFAEELATRLPREARLEPSARVAWAVGLPEASLWELAEIATERLGEAFRKRAVGVALLHAYPHEGETLRTLLSAWRAAEESLRLGKVELRIDPAPGRRVA